MAAEAINCSNQTDNAQGEVLPASYKVYCCGWESMPTSISGTWNYAGSAPPCLGLTPRTATAFTLLPNGGGPNTCDTTYFEINGAPFAIILLFPITPYTEKYIPIFGFSPPVTGGYISRTCTETTIDLEVNLAYGGTCLIHVHVTGVTF